MQSNRRSAQFDFVRGIAIVGVVILHSGFESRFDSKTLSIWQILSALFDWSVLAFFFTSGFFLKKAPSYAFFLKKRFFTLLVPFLAYNFLYNLAFAAGKAFGLTQCHQFKVVPSLLLSGGFKSPAFQLYFLPYLYGVAAVIYLLCSFIVPSRRWILLVVGSIGLVAVYQWIGWPRYSYGPELTKLPLYLVAFLLGVVCQPILQRPPKFLFVLTCLVCVICFALLQQTILQSLMVPPLLCSAVGVIRFFRDSKLLSAIGHASGTVYLWHTPIVLPAFTAILALLHVPALINFVASIVLTIALCLLLRKVCKQAIARSSLTRFIGPLVP